MGRVRRHPTLGQWRGQIEYAFSGCNAIGLWACKRDLERQQTFAVVHDRDRHESGDQPGQSVLAPQVLLGRRQLAVVSASRTTAGSTATAACCDWTIGASVQVPLTDSLALYANGATSIRARRPATAAAVESGYNVGMGIAWYFGGSARNHAINGQCADAVHAGRQQQQLPGRAEAIQF